MEDLSLAFHAIKKWIQSMRCRFLIDIKDDCQIWHQVPDSNLTDMIDGIS